MAAKRTAKTISKSKRTAKPKRRICRECGNNVSFLVANEFPIDEEDVKTINALNPNDRNQVIAQRILKILGTGKNAEYGTHAGKAISFFPKGATKWTTSQQERIATSLAPFSRVAKRELHVYGERPQHLHGS